MSGLTKPKAMRVKIARHIRCFEFRMGKVMT